MFCITIWQNQNFEHQIHNKLDQKIFTKLELRISSLLHIAMVMQFPSLILNVATTKFGCGIKENALMPLFHMTLA